MNISLSQKILLVLFVVTLSCILIVEVSLTNDTQESKTVNQPYSSLPIIQGIVLPEGQALADFSLMNHHNQVFNQNNLLGKWYFITYGYTQCPDICPTTLFTLTQVAEKLRKTNQLSKTSFMFYSIDSQRDTIKLLANYIQYFDESFIAAKTNNPLEQKNFESNLGIKAVITKNDNSYQVSHGLNIFLLNPEGELQAVFIPQRTELGIEHLTSEQIIDGYLQVKTYYQNQFSI